MRTRSLQFTLIELIVVIAILAILRLLFYFFVADKIEFLICPFIVYLRKNEFEIWIFETFTGFLRHF